jgi:YcxB-like protein
MKLEFTYTAEDFDELAKIKWPEEARQRQLSLWTSAVLIPIFMTVLFGISFFDWLSPAGPNPSVTYDWHKDWQIILGSIGCLFSLIIFYVFQFNRRKKFGRAFLRSRPIVQQPQTAMIGDDDIVVSTPLGASQFRWASFVNWTETPIVFALRMTGRHGILVLPKRAATDEQQIELRELFKFQIIMPTGAFPVTIAADSWPDT